MLVKRGLLWMYVCLQEQKKKIPNVSKVPRKPHTLEVLSCKEPQLSTPPNLFTILHLQT